MAMSNEDNKFGEEYQKELFKQIEIEPSKEHMGFIYQEARKCAEAYDIKKSIFTKIKFLLKGNDQNWGYSYGAFAAVSMLLGIGLGLSLQNLSNSQTILHGGEQIQLQGFTTMGTNGSKLLPASITEWRNADKETQRKVIIELLKNNRIEQATQLLNELNKK